MKILYEDKDVVVLIKPVGVPSETTQNGEEGILTFLNSQNNNNNYLLHRLDRNVGGVMVFAKNKKSAAFLSKQIAENTLKKTYLAVVTGKPENPQGVLEDLLFKDSQKNRSFVVKRERKGVKKASLEYIVLNEKDGKSLLKITLHTGRTHQIRVQFSSRKMSLLGDRKYGSKENCDIALFSHALSFLHPQTNEKMTFSAFPEKEKYPWNLFGGDLSE